MKLSADLFLAWKYFKPKRNAVSVITLISIVGVCLGVAVLVVVLAVMTGFTDKMKEKLLDSTAHVQIYSGNSSYIGNPAYVLEKVKEAGGTAMSVTIGPMLLQHNDQFIPKQMIAFDPETMPQNFAPANRILEGKFSLDYGEIMMSYLTAGDLGVIPGDKILLHSPNKLSKLVKTDKSGKIEAAQGAYLPGEFTISGIFSFGKYDFDKNMIFLCLDDADELFGLPYGAATAVYVWTPDPYNMDSFMKKLKNDLPFFRVYSWRDLNKQLLSVLNVEKNMQFFLLAFIVLVAAFSITNTLITTVIQKTREIGLLKSIGASSGTIMRIFLLQGFFVGIIGTGCGLILGALVVRFRMNILQALRVITGQEIFPKEFYAFSELPAHIVPSDLVITALIAVALCTLGGVIPAFRAAKLDPAGALRSEQ